MTVTYTGNQTSGAALTADNFAEQRHVKDAVAIMGLQKERTPPMSKGDIALTNLVAKDDDQMQTILVNMRAKLSEVKP